MKHVKSLGRSKAASLERHREYLDRKHDEYLCSRRNLTTDVRFSIEACITIALVASYMEKSETIAA